MRAQQPPKPPIIGLLSSVSFQSYAVRVAALRQGLIETGFVEGKNITIEYRSADGRLEKLPALVADLVGQKVDVIVTIGGEVPARAAKTATSTIPIVFAAGGDPVDFGLVASLSRPEGNVTGVSFFSNELGPKRIELLRELSPQADRLAFLMGSTSTTANAERSDKELMLAARNIGLQGVILRADTEQKIDEAFTRIVQLRVAGLVVENDAYLNSRRDQIVALAARHKVPAIYAYREHIQAGALISYGTDVNEMYRQAGIYTARILKGDKPGDLPVLLPNKFELIINVKTANGLGLSVPQNLLARADEVIE
jgi:putative ABC transport system substrate-binding protein